MIYGTNIREKAELIIEWLGWHHEDIAYGLRSVADAEKLYDYWQDRGGILPEFCDDDADDESVDVGQHRLDALGYDPLDLVAAQAWKQESEDGGLAEFSPEDLDNTKVALRLLKNPMARMGKEDRMTDKDRNALWAVTSFTADQPLRLQVIQLMIESIAAANVLAAALVQKGVLESDEDRTTLYDLYKLTGTLGRIRDVFGRNSNTPWLDRLKAFWANAPTPTADACDIDAFVWQMKAGMAKAAEKGRSGWKTASHAHLQDLLQAAVGRQDWVAVGNYAMMLNHLSTS